MTSNLANAVARVEVKDPDPLVECCGCDEEARGVNVQLVQFPRNPIALVAAMSEANREKG